MLFLRAMVYDSVWRVRSICPARLGAPCTGGNSLLNGGIVTRKPSLIAFPTVREESVLSNLKGSIELEVAVMYFDFSVQLLANVRYLIIIYTNIFMLLYYMDKEIHVSKHNVC